MPALRESRYLFGFLVASAAGMAAVLLFALYAAWLPHPERATRTQLLYWVVTRELNRETPELRQVLLRRLVEEFREVQDFGTQGDRGLAGLEPTYRRRLEINADLLTREWFAAQVSDYAVRPSERAGLVAQVLDTAVRWSQFSQELGGLQEADSDSFDRVESLIASVPESQRALASGLVADTIALWLADQEVGEWGPDKQRELAQHIADELDRRPLSAGVVDERISPERSARMRRNADVLLASWVLMQAETLGALPAEEQELFVDERLEQVARWGLVQAFEPSLETASAFGRMQSLMRLEQLLQRWIAAATPEQREPMSRMAELVRRRVVQQAVRSLF